jgi:phosphate/sulfate permease
MNNLVKEITTKTFMSMDSDDWFAMAMSMLVGIGLVLFVATFFNTIAGDK